MKKWYYLDGIKKKGPFTKEELLKFDLSNKVLVWKEGFEDWKKLGDVLEFSTKLPPPIPQQIINKRLQSQRNLRIILTILVFIICCSLTLLISHYSVETQKKRYYNDISNHIDKILNGNSFAFDGINITVDGHFMNYDSIESIIFKPSKKLDELYGFDENDRKPSFLDKLKQQDNENNQKRFEPESGGFEFVMLTEDDKGHYRIEELSSGKMLCKEELASMKNIQDFYINAYESFIDENQHAFQQNEFQSINGIQYIENDFYYFANEYKPQEYNGVTWNRSGEIFNDIWTVFYMVNGKGYYIKEKQIQKKKNTYRITGFGVGLILSILFAIKFPFKSSNMN